MKEINVKPCNITIVGGGGYIGYHIGVALSHRGHSVTLFDISHPDPFWLTVTNMIAIEKQSTVSIVGDTSWDEEHIIYTKRGTKNCSAKTGNYLRLVVGSLLDTKKLDKVLMGADCVILCASYGMSGKEQMPTQWSLTEQVNIAGTENVLKVCQIHGVRALVYTSSFNVVFGGQYIADGDESLPYFPLHQHVDHYSRTKAIAERLVLFADKLAIADNKNASTYRPLRTCALRLAGVMGLGEKRHLPRIVDYFGFMFFRYGYGDNSLQQFVTLKNVVQAHVKAAEYLLTFPERLGGQAYFISDGTPINTFEFLRPLRESLGYKQPTLSAPMWLIWTFVYIIQVAHALLSSIHPSLSFPPMLTPAEVYKTAVTHYFSSNKAERDFGYRPENPNDISDVIQYYSKRQKSRPQRSLVVVFAIRICFVLSLAFTLYFIFNNIR